MPKSTLHQLVRHRGLDACGDMVRAATAAELTLALDLDLWRPGHSGGDVRLDADRFGEWLDMLAGIGDDIAARTVAALDTNLVVAGLSRYVRVFDPGIFEPTAHSDDEGAVRHESMREGDGASDGALPLDAWAADTLECEVGGYIVRARRSDTWDAIVGMLVALDTDHGPAFHAVMQGCRRLSNSAPETDGLDDLLGTAAQHLHEVAVEREQRQTAQGYVTPGDARVFLHTARRAPHGPRHEGIKTEPVSGLLHASAADPRAGRLWRLRSLLASMRDVSEEAFLQRSHELAFLANVLLAGCSRPFTPQEAADAAASTCNLGLECWPGPAPALIDRRLVTAFEAGWSLMHQQVSVFVAHQLAAAITSVHGVDPAVRVRLAALRRSLVAHADAGTPWLAGGAADVLAELDVTVWVSVLALLDECPVVPAAMTAILERQTSGVSQTSLDFIATADQIDDIRRFTRMLPELLSRA